MRQGYLPRHRQLAAADQADIGDGVVGGAEGAGGDDGGTPAGEAGDAMDTGGLERFRQARRRQEGGEAPRQPRLPCLRRAEEQDMMVTTPAGSSPLGLSHSVVAAMAPTQALEHDESPRVFTCAAVTCLCVATGSGARSWSGPKPRQSHYGW
jgi:hypothetical protein